MGFLIDPVPHLLQVGSPGAESLPTLLLLCPGCSQACFSLFPSLPGSVLLFSKSIFPEAAPLWLQGSAVRWVDGREPAGTCCVWRATAPALPCRACPALPAPGHLPQGNTVLSQLSQLVQGLSHSCLRAMLRRLQRYAVFC